jgi:hypothetical protein
MYEEHFEYSIDNPIQVVIKTFIKKKSKRFNQDGILERIQKHKTIVYEIQSQNCYLKEIMKLVSKYQNWYEVVIKLNGEVLFVFESSVFNTDYHQPKSVTCYMIDSYDIPNKLYIEYCRTLLDYHNSLYRIFDKFKKLFDQFLKTP